MFKGRHFERSVILLCVRWYLAYNLSLRDLEEMMAERGLSVDHSTVHRWVVYYSPRLLAKFNARKRPVLDKWHVDETYIKVRGKSMYLYRAIDKSGATAEFLFSQTRNLKDAKRFFHKAFDRHGLPTQVTIDGSQTNCEAARASHGAQRMLTRSQAKPLIIRRSRYLNNRIEQDHRRIKRRIRPMLGFKSTTTASVILGGIELIHMLRKGQMANTDGNCVSLADQFEALAG